MLRVPSTGGVELAVHDLGGPPSHTAPVVLFAHATGLNARVWEPMAAALRDRFSCLAVDFRGHGLSELPEGADVEWPRMGEDVEAVLCSELIAPEQPVHGVGHSMGGAALVLAASATGPRLRSLWLYEPIIAGPGLMPATGGDNPLAEGALRRRASFPSYEAAYENYSSKPPLNELAPDALWGYVLGGFAEQPDGTVTLRCTPSTEAAVFRAAPASGAWDVAATLTQPTEVVSGREEAFGPGSYAPLLVAELANARLLERGDLGHFGPLEDPGGLALDVEHWIDSNS
jgi:pimeloyl-ACP methyl ester carboxylesterase